MQIESTVFNADVYDILTELHSQLEINGIHLLQAISDTSDNVMIACPYHKGGQERRPSMGVRKSDGLCHCFACDKIVTLPEMISYCFAKDETGFFGWTWLLKNFATFSVEERKDVKVDYSRNTVAIGNRSKGNVLGTDNTAQPTFVSEEELDKYRYTHPYWEKRKITDERLLELFDLGYDKDTQCITMPVRDVQGNCLFVARRSVHTKFFNYPRGVEKPLYGLYELRQQHPFPTEIIVCESMIDALTAWQYGKYAVALNGLGTQLQFKQLRELPCRELILATDADEAGMGARTRIRKNVPNKIISEYKWDLSVAKDLNDMEKSYFDSLEKIF